MTTEPAAIEWPQELDGEKRRDPAADAQLTMTLELEKLEVSEATK